MISHTHRCIFIHIPRTGGTSIEEVIWPGDRTTADLWMGMTDWHRNKYQTDGLQHLLARQIRQEVGDDVFRSYFKFSFVRHPLDRALSGFAYMAVRPDLRMLIGMKEDDDFLTYLHLIGQHEHVHWERQVEFLHDGAGAPLADFVGRFETLEDDARRVFDRVGLGARPLPYKNATKRRRDLDWVSDEARQIVHRRYERDFDLLGYLP